MTILNFFSNLIWIFTGGFWLALAWLIEGVLLCITIIGIPFGLQCFKMATLSFAPFGKKVKLGFPRSYPIINVIWAILFGWEMALGYALAGIANCVTIIGIPSGIQSFKMMALAIFPFGATVE